MEGFQTMNKNFWQEFKKPILALAPMAGISDAAFRLLCRKHGADVVYTEMTSIDALYYDAKKTLSMLKRLPGEKPVVLQLFGKRPELVAKAVKYVEKAGFSGIDFNFGCPAKKVVRHGGGVTLLKNLDLVHDLLKAACENTKLPISVKTRTSINDGKKKITVFDFIEKIKDLPIAALMIHGRSYEQGFVGEVDYEIIKEVKKRFKGIVIGNGGLDSPEKVKIMLDRTGVDGVGIARGVYGRPWIFEQIQEYLKSKKYFTPDLKYIKKMALEHARYNYKMKGDHGLVEMRKHLCWYFRGFPQASSFRKELVLFKTIDELKQIFKRIK